MSINDAIKLSGGLALFLYGMQMMGDGLEGVAGNRMKRILERLTTNRFMGVLVGTVITAIIQSSSATTVMLVGFVNSGLMSLSQAVGVIMGANIGTTMTAQLIALDISKIAPLFAFVGVVMAVFFKKQKVVQTGVILAGLGVLFIGMSMMSDALRPLRQSAYFINLMVTMENPLLGILVGLVFTSIVQSSSASIGILQTLALGGLIQLRSAVFIMLGMKIGTCITAALASIGTNRSAKRVAIVHYTFNIIEAVIFAVIFRTTGLVDLVYSWTPLNPSAQIANMHTLCSVAMTAVAIPFAPMFANFAERILPEKEYEAGDMQFKYIQYHGIGEGSIGFSAVTVTLLLKEVHRMFEFAKRNVILGFISIKEHSAEHMEEVQGNEEIVDFLNKELVLYISRILTTEMNHETAMTVSSMLTVASNVERISDHAVNFAEYAGQLAAQGISFSDIALDEVQQMYKVCSDALNTISRCIYVSERGDASDPNAPDILEEINKAELVIDDMTELFRSRQVERMIDGTCAPEASIIYSEILTDFERIGDHMLNIAEVYDHVKSA